LKHWWKVKKGGKIQVSAISDCKVAIKLENPTTDISNKTSQQCIKEKLNKILKWLSNYDSKI
jgi:hypothetical protein